LVYLYSFVYFFFFFFQAEDGIRDFHVTGVQTCALPIWAASRTRSQPWPPAEVCSSCGKGAQAVAYRNWKGRQPRRTASAGASRARQKAAHAPGSSVSSSKTTPSAEVNGGPPGAVSAASASSAPAAARYCETASSPARSTLTSVLVTREPRAWARSPASRPCTVRTPAAVAA